MLHHPRTHRPASLTLLIALSLLSYGQAQTERGPKAPNFRLMDLNNRPVQLYDLLLDGPVLLDFWATWCSPCLKSMPLLQNLHETYRTEGLQIVGINVDGPRSASKIKPFIRSRRVTFKHLRDKNGDVMRLFDVQAIPTSILIAEDGTILRRRLAAEVADHHGLELAIEAALGLDNDPQ